MSFEASLTGVIIGLCSWVGDRMRHFDSDFKELSEAGMTATMSALFTTPLYGFAEGVRKPLAWGGVTEISRPARAVIYMCAIADALAVITLLRHFIGNGCLRHSTTGSL